MASSSRSSDFHRPVAAQRRAAEAAERQATRATKVDRKAQIKKYELSRAEQAAAMTAESEWRWAISAAS